MIKKLLSLAICCVGATTVLQAQDIVVNRIFQLGSNNTTGQYDAVELLVIKDKLDIRNWIIKEFGNGLTDDTNGGKYRFNNDLLWSNLRSGTVITLREGMANGDLMYEGALATDTYTQDLDKSDFKLDVSFKNTTYFTPLLNDAPVPVTKNFIFTTSSEAVLIRSDDGTGSGMGYANAVHLMAWGSDLASKTILTSDLASCKKVYAAAAGPGIGGFIFTKSTTQSIADFDGGSGKGGRQNTALATNAAYNWGGGYGEEADATYKNKAYIAALRAVVLPVNASNFKISVSNDGAQVSFVTFSERNNAHFNIYRAKNDTDFSLIGTLEGNGTTNSRISYVYNDHSPFAGTNYYQIEQVDLDGKKTVIYTDFADFGMREKKVFARFTDANQLNLNVVSDSEDLANINLTDINGKSLLSVKQPLAMGLNNLNFGLADGAKGILVLSVSTTTGREVIKLLR